MNRRRWQLVFLVAAALLIKIFSLFPEAVENYYSSGAYPVIAVTLRILFGWIPFSIGDLLYAVVIVFLIYQAFIFIRGMVRKQVTKMQLLYAVEKFFLFVLWVYVSFNLLWGLNYNRPPMARHLNIRLKQYSVPELRSVMQLLVARLNDLDSSSMLYRKPLSSKKKLFNESVAAYHLSEPGYPFLTYKQASLKPSIYSYLGNYLGFSGYYNPFSGEAQVNTTIPAFIQPFVSCHEIGHQLGFAKENEANFAGFLSARGSANPAFRYSVYFDMYSYALSELYRRDSVGAKSIHQSLDPQVQEDYAAMQRFFGRFQNPIEPVIRAIYGRYLKANDQPGGMRSYNQVVAMLVAYKKKYGSL